MEHPAVRSRKKLDKVYVLMARQTRARLKLVAGIKNMPLFDLLNAICIERIGDWEKLNNIDLDKVRKAETSRGANGDGKLKRGKAP